MDAVLLAVVLGVPALLFFGGFLLEMCKPSTWKGGVLPRGDNLPGETEDYLVK